MLQGKTREGPVDTNSDRAIDHTRSTEGANRAGRRPDAFGAYFSHLRRSTVRSTKFLAKRTTATDAYDDGRLDLMHFTDEVFKESNYCQLTR